MNREPSQLRNWIRWNVGLRKRRRQLLACLVGVLLVCAGLCVYCLEVFQSSGAQLPASADLEARFEEPATPLEMTTKPVEQTPAPQVRQPVVYDDVYDGWIDSPGDKQLAYLRSLVVADTSSAHQLLADLIDVDEPSEASFVAFDVALEISSTREPPSSEVATLLRGFRARAPKMRLHALAAAREHPHPELVQPLADIIDRGGNERGPAMTALAYIDDRDARAKLRDILGDKDYPEKDRLRAVALLSVSLDDSAIPLLYDLQNGESEQLRIAATNILREAFKISTLDR